MILRAMFTSWRNDTPCLGPLIGKPVPQPWSFMQPAVKHQGMVQVCVKLLSRVGNAITAVRDQVLPKASAGSASWEVLLDTSFRAVCKVGLSCLFPACNGQSAKSPLHRAAQARSDFYVDYSAWSRLSGMVISFTR